MNFFEGGRRVLMIIVGISVLVALFDNDPILTRARNLGLWIAFVWGSAWAIGWVVRGVLGIPNGQDSKD